MSNVKPLKQEDARALKALLDALGTFLKLDPNMPVQQIRAFLLVAMEEGLGTMELSERAGIDNTVMTRHIAGLADLNRYKTEGHNLVYQKTDVLDKRTRKAYLTPDGVTKRHEIVRAMQH
jgi:DNA-binding MarR family transcriptional regulator